MVYEKEKVSQRNRNKVPKPPNVIWISDFIVELTCSSKLKPILFISLSFPPSLTSQFVQLGLMSRLFHVLPISKPLCPLDFLPPPSNKSLAINEPSYPLSLSLNKALGLEVTYIHCTCLS